MTKVSGVEDKTHQTIVAGVTDTIPISVFDVEGFNLEKGRGTFMNKLRLPAAAIGLAVLASAAGVMPAALAAQVKTHVTVTPGGPFTLTNPGALTQQVTVGLDSNCLNALGHGQTFGIAASTNNSAVATVSPPSATGLQCGDTANFTITGVGDGSATIRFDAVATPGLQKQTAGQSVGVTVTGFGTTNPPPNPGGHDRPAAPAVANAYISSDSQAAACKAAYDGAKNWHGQLIRSVAKWAATNHLGKAKDDTSRFPTDNDWIVYVQTEVNALCS